MTRQLRDYVAALKYGASIADEVIESLGVTAVVGRNSRAQYQADGVADNVQLQAAIDAVADAGGGTVVIKGGTYRIASSLVIPFDSRISIVAERMARTPSGGVTLKTSAGVTLTDLVKVEGNADPSTNADLTHDVTFENITFDGNNTTTNLVKLTNQDTVKFRNCRLIQGTNSVVTVWDSASDPTASTIPGGVYLDWCNVSANSGVGIDFQYQTQCWISNCWFTGSSVTTWINLLASNKVKITNCEFNTATQGIYFQDTATYPTNDITITGCVFAVGSSNKAWREARTHASSLNIAITGCTLPSGVTYDSLANSGNILANSNMNYSQGNVTGATTFNRVNGQHISATLTGSITVTLSDGGYRGDTLTLKLTQDGTGNRTATWPSKFKKAGGSLTLSTSAAAVDVITMQWDGTNWNEVSRALDVS